MDHIQELEDHLSKISNKPSQSKLPSRTGMFFGWTKVSAIGYEITSRGLTTNILPSQTRVDILSFEKKEDGSTMCLCQANLIKLFLPLECIFF